MTTTTVAAQTHSPTPWTLSPAAAAQSMDAIRDRDGKAVAFVGRLREHKQANAALLLAAPSC